ncbi:MAG: putative Fe-S center protein [Paraglaciecola sp.]|jgi:hypothetical protein
MSNNLKKRSGVRLSGVNHEKKLISHGQEGFGGTTQMLSLGINVMPRKFKVGCFR